MPDKAVISESLGDAESSFVKDLGLDDQESGYQKPKENDKKEPESEEIPEDQENQENQENQDNQEEQEEQGEQEDKDNKDNEPEPVTEQEEPEDLSEEELAKYPKDARGILRDLQKERGRRKKAEAELDFVKLNEKYNKLEPEGTAKDKVADPEDKFETVEDILKDKTDDDLLSAGEIRRIEVARKKESERDAKVKTESKTKEQKEIELQTKRTDALEDVFKKTHSDYSEMFEIFKLAVEDMPSLRLEIIAELRREGGNPAQKAYELGKKFKGIYGKSVKPVPGSPKSGDVNRILKNAEKKTTSASIPGSSVSNEVLEEMDVDELGKTLSSMPMAQFMRVPRRIRQKALR